MQKDSQFWEDISRMASGAAGTMLGAKQEVEALFRAQAETFLRNMQLVTREEYEAQHAMLAKAREQQEQLSARVEVLEAQLGITPPEHAPSPEAHTAAQDDAPSHKAGEPDTSESSSNA